MIHFDMPPQKSNIIKVLGFGGGGGNAVNFMYEQNIQNVDFIICNTDAQALQKSPIPNKIQLGPHLTQGLGAGANPSIGRQATEESLEEIRRMLEVNTKMAFITAGMGGGTGTGGAPTVAKICKELNILTVGIVTTPFSFEGPKRMAQAQAGIKELKDNVDTLLVISNDKLREQYGNLKMKEAFGKADDVLTTAARCITDVINSTGQINVDFSDVCTVMRDGGVAILGSAALAGENRAAEAIVAAMNSPLLNDNDISGAKWILLNITSAEGEHEFSMDEVEIIQDYVRQQAGENSDVILGMGYDESLGDKLGITIIATGFEERDPFVIPTTPKEEPKAEPVIVMELGKVGDEQKMYEQPKPVAEAPKVDAMAPTILPAFTNTTPTQNNSPVLDSWMDAVDKGETKQAPVEHFKLDIAETPKQETPTPQPAAMPATPSKPASIYANSAQPTPKPETVVEVADELKLELSIVDEDTTPANKAPNKAVAKEETEEDLAISGISLSFTDDAKQTPPMPQTVVPATNFDNTDLSEEEENRRKALERINRLRKLNFNPNATDNAEYDQVPAYMRRNTEFQHNTIANVEDFYSRSQVKATDGKDTVVSTINNFLHGKKPD